MPTTSNFGWTTPADTDLVKDGALAIRILGNGIDTSMAELKGGTTGQVLSKNSNTDLDFTWVEQDDSNAIQNALLTTTGDTIYASAASTPARLGIGSTGQVLTVSGGVPTWATASSGGYTLINTGGTTLSGSSVTISSIPATYTDLYILATNYDPVNDDEQLRFYINSDNGTKYYNATVAVGQGTFNTTSARLVYSQDNGTSNSLGFTFIRGYTANTWKIFNGFCICNHKTTTTDFVFNPLNGLTNITSAVSSITFINDTGNFSGGTVYVYGVK